MYSPLYRIETLPSILIRDPSYTMDRMNTLGTSMRPSGKPSPVFKQPQRACPNSAQAWQCTRPDNGGRATFLCTGPRRCPLTRRLKRRFNDTCSNGCGPPAGRPGPEIMCATQGGLWPVTRISSGQSWCQLHPNSDLTGLLIRADRVGWPASIGGSTPLLALAGQGDRRRAWRGPQAPSHRLVGSARSG